MSTSTVDDNLYSYDTLFSKNHITTNQIIEKIRMGKIDEILNGYIHINENGIIIEPKYLKQFACQNTYDLIVNYMDQTIIQFLMTKQDTFNMYINLQSVSIIDIEKHTNFLRYISTLFSTKYPDKLNKCYLYKASIIFEAIFKVIKGFIDKVTLDKIQLIKE
jgi:hypothetical protein